MAKQSNQMELGLVFYEDASTTEPILDEDRSHHGNKNSPNMVFREVIKRDYLDRVIRTLSNDMPLREIDYHLLGVVGCSRVWAVNQQLHVSFEGDIPHSDSEYREYITLANKD